MIKQFHNKRAEKIVRNMKVVHPRFNNKTKIRFVSNDEILKSQSCGGIGQTPKIPIYAFHVKGLKESSL